MRLKISVLASGAILLDGQPADLEQLDAALQRAKQNHGQVWYYREAAGAQPPAAGLAVIQRVVQHKLPISLSSKADFSDWVDGKGVSRARAAEGAAAAFRAGRRACPRSAFARISRKSSRACAKPPRRRATGGIAILKPDRTHLVMPRLAASAIAGKHGEEYEPHGPGEVPRNIAAIAYTHLRCRRRRQRRG